MKNRLKFLSIFNRGQKLLLVLVTACFLVTASIETAALAVIYPFMRSLLNPASISSSGWYCLLSKYIQLGSEREYLAAFSLLLVGLYLLKGAVLLLVNRLELRILTEMRADFSQKMYSDFLHLPYAILKGKNSAEVQSTLTTDVSYVFNAVTAFLSMIQQSLMAVAFVCMLLVIDPYLTCGLVVLLAIGFLLFRKLTSRLTTTAGQRTRTAFIGMIQTVRESMGQIKQVLASRKQRPFEEMFDAYRQTHAREERKVLYYQRVPKILFETLIMCTVLLYIWRTVCTGKDFAARLPVLITFALTTIKLIPVVSLLANNANVIRFTGASTDRVCAVLDECRRSLSEPSGKAFAVEPLQDGIEVNHLSFGYEDGELLLDDVSFRIPARQITAFTGKTGAGKTTLADLILGLYPLEEGAILADGHDISRESDWWAAHVGYVTQSVMLRDTTVRDNITRGAVGQKPDEARIWKCLEDVQLAEYIRSLPDALDTRTGENGVRFSGGQIQRLAIAQALYDDPTFLVMDESTGALDRETELQILETLQKLRESRTILLITHRSSASAFCDPVYQVEGGKVQRIHHNCAPAHNSGETL